MFTLDELEVSVSISGVVTFTVSALVDGSPNSISDLSEPHIGRQFVVPEGQLKVTFSFSELLRLLLWAIKLIGQTKPVGETLFVLLDFSGVLIRE